MKTEYKALIETARKVKLSAYAPYSKFQVGAAILTADNRIFTGCNIENSSFSLTICAERVAIFKAVSEGAKKFKSIAIVSDDKGYTPPCGACRQVLFDLAGDIDVIMTSPRKKDKVVKLSSLLPFAFSGNNLNQTR